jgi:hypothetical protein
LVIQITAAAQILNRLVGSQVAAELVLKGERRMTTVASDADRVPVDRLLDDGRLAVIPEWVLDADVSDRAIRLYGLLACYRQSSGSRMPSLSTLARRLRTHEAAEVDVALHELAAVGAVRIQVRTFGRGRLISSYELRTVRPSGFTVASDPRANGSTGESHRESISGSMMSPGAIVPIWSVCGIADWADFVEACRRTRTLIGQSPDRWTGGALAAALRIAVCERERPAMLAPAALLLLAGDVETRSPMRLAEAGPWWDADLADGAPSIDTSVMAAERRLAEVGGLRLSLQQRAREQLAAEGIPVTRATVATRAVALLDEHQAHAGS